ncbi:hypothetical protein [Umezawaea sp. Da 62-37]|uniref:hypothetical protein n=1 Tax=Umezawaea sp. Da 62-37 TaxID=3075927 RepID=UPI0028F74CB8|nr:hypothetical protein [Umezawaea sp. Da 62-37]WNV91132.1 hypothetical protein RM788_23490 [Umezawaea sp. Da 62-37]
MVIMLLFVVVAVIVLLSSKRSSSPQRDQELHYRWYEIHEMCRRTPGTAIVRVAHVYQRAQRGTKAVVVLVATGYQQDAWFAHSNPVPGSYLLVRGRTGWGPHNSNPEVLYVELGEVLYTLPPDTVQACERHRQLVIASQYR